MRSLRILLPSLRALTNYAKASIQKSFDLYACIEVSTPAYTVTQRCIHIQKYWHTCVQKRRNIQESNIGDNDHGNNHQRTPDSPILALNRYARFLIVLVHVRLICVTAPTILIHVSIPITSLCDDHERSSDSTILVLKRHIACLVVRLSRSFLFMKLLPQPQYENIRRYARVIYVKHSCLSVCLLSVWISSRAYESFMRIK